MNYEKRTDKEYLMVNGDLIEKICKHEFKTINDIPKPKCFDFLRKAFENNPWKNITYFSKFKDQDRIYKVENFYFDFIANGYVILMEYSYNDESFIDYCYNVSTFDISDKMFLDINKMKMITTV